MLRRLRWKFIGTAMLAVLIVLTLLVSGINLAYRSISIDGLDHMLDMIAANQGRIPENVPGTAPWGFRMTPETPFETRFFLVRRMAGGEDVAVQTDYIASVSAEDAETYLRQALAAGQTRGFVAQYRFLRVQEADGTVFVFLDSSRQLQAFRTLLLISSLITCAALCLTFFLVWLLSSRVIRPTLRSIESQKRFITDASHEIKTPLTVISSYADVMCMEDEQNEWARGIQKESHRLAQLVADLVLLSRWDEEEPIRETRRFDLSRAIWDTVTPYKHLAEAGGMRFSVQIAEGLQLEGDEGAIQTALSTLLENAVKYSLPDSEIHLTAEKLKRSVSIQVSNACALPEDLELERLFDRFYRADPSRSRDSGGAGVGLSIARAILEAHGGKIAASREAGDRVLFRITLPAA
ncbi:MAG: HAMP domain-containing histidine kinase [Oscillospiraceae bacterium]|nr:HAMP domain-containing histidine kinase [Oscillospiraceae bacterium]